MCHVKINVLCKNKCTMYLQIEKGTADKRKSDLKNSFAVIEAQHKVIASTLHSLNTKP